MAPERNVQTSLQRKKMRTQIMTQHRHNCRYLGSELLSAIDHVLNPRGPGTTQADWSPHYGRGHI